MSPTFHVFGDESASNSNVSYALLVLAENDLEVASSLISDLKRRHGIPASAEIHCRRLFAGTARRKTDFAALDRAQTEAFAVELAEIIAKSDWVRVVCSADRREFPKSLPKLDWTPELKFETKQLGVWCANGALIPILERVSPHKVRLWLDLDCTKIDWLDRRAQATLAMGGMFYDLKHAEPIRVRPEGSEPARRQLLEFADFLAYCSVRALSIEARSDKAFFDNLFRRMNPALTRFGRTPQGGYGVNVPNVLPWVDKLGPPEFRKLPG